MLNPRPHRDRTTTFGQAGPGSISERPGEAETTTALAGASAALLTPDQAAEMLRVAPGVLERWRGTGDGPSYV